MEPVGKAARGPADLRLGFRMTYSCGVLQVWRAAKHSHQRPALKCNFNPCHLVCFCRQSKLGRAKTELDRCGIEACIFSSTVLRVH